jgi:queuine/archaeosine tRNA-ribosyltransferase
MAAECPYDFVPIQGLLGATQRDFVAIVRAAFLAWPETAPFYYLGVGSRLLARSQRSVASAPPEQQFNRS